MQIVTDTGMDMYLPPELMLEIPIHIADVFEGLP